MKVLTTNLIEQLDDRCKEAFKTLRSNIGFVAEGCKVITFTSATSAEGTWKVALNLATSYAQLGKRTLFLDANLRDAELKKFYTEIEDGLTEYLEDKAKIQDVVCITNIDTFNVILPGGYPKNPTELLGGERFEELIKTTKQIFDYVIIATPALDEVVDAAMISKLSDGTVIVIDAIETKFQQVEEAKKQLSLSGCNILGCVYNELPEREKSYRRLL